jgi:hypothetical protein
MNDFTKEELQQFLNWRNSILYTKKPTKELIAINTSLGCKIQSIIDTYCDHEYDFDSTESIKCKHCDKIINHEPY